MPLDFGTLYVVILANSLSLIVLWAAISIVHRDFEAAQLWLLALIMSCLGGLLLAGDGPGTLSLFTYSGMVLITGGFAMMWQGIRVFHGNPPDIGGVAAVMALTAFAIAIAGPTRAEQNIVYAVTQLVPLCLAIRELLNVKAPTLGAVIAMGSIGLAGAGHAVEAASNLLRVLGALSIEAYYGFAAWLLMCAIIGGSIWNFGFLLMAIDRLREDLKELATRDDLTKLPNRGGLREKARLIEKMARRKDDQVIVMMIDLDKFKSINDQYGHAAGDACLIHIAKVAKSVLSDDDVLARLSGDEFCVLMPNTDYAGASLAAKKLTQSIEAMSFFWKGQGIRTSLSIGITEWSPRSEVPLSQAFEQADIALYEVKKNGRNGYNFFNGRGA